jgi:hypothetical protein
MALFRSQAVIGSAASSAGAGLSAASPAVLIPLSRLRCCARVGEGPEPTFSATQHSRLGIAFPAPKPTFAPARRRSGKQSSDQRMSVCRDWELQPLSHHAFGAGHRLEVNVTSSNFPRRARNTNSGHPILAIHQSEAASPLLSHGRLETADFIGQRAGRKDGAGHSCPIVSEVFRGATLLINEFGQRYFVDQGRQTTNLACISLTKVSALPISTVPTEGDGGHCAAY